MALLQISEPGMSTAPHQHKLAVGIDLGTTHSLVATVRSGMVQVLSDEQGQVLVPSVVHYLSDGQAKVGDEALNFAVSDPDNTLFSIKRFMGRGLKDIPAIQKAHYDLLDAPGMVQFKTVAGVKSPVEISAQILAYLRQRAEQYLGDSLVGAVVTVPAYFDDAQRQATKDAAKLAGINVLRLLSEPTAAAIAYGLEHAAEGLYAVYDLGGGTFDISILRLSRGIFEVLAIGGDAALGGDDFDLALYQWALEKIPDAEKLSNNDKRQLLIRCRWAKEKLSQQPSANIEVICAGRLTMDLEIDQQKFFEITQVLIEKTLQAVRYTLRDANLKTDDIQGVVLVGGATRMLHVRRALTDLFHRPPLTNLDPDQVVAVGAAMQANLLVGNRLADQDWLLLDVIPLSLGIETMGGIVEKIIPRNATLPLARAQEFTTFKDGQTAISIHVVQGERELAADCRSLARFELQGIPPMVAGAARVRVTYQVDADGLLSITAREIHSGVEAAIAVKPSYGLQEEDITRMLQDSIREAESDMHMRNLREQQVEARRILEAVNSALAADAELLDDNERILIDQKINILNRHLLSDDAQLLKTATADLVTVTEVFAERRMHKNIRAALAGKTLEQIEKISGTK